MPESKTRIFGFAMPKANQRSADPVALRLNGSFGFPRAPGLIPERRPEDDAVWFKGPGPVPEAQRGTDIFIGGLFDDLPIPISGHVMRDYADSYAKETGRTVRYLPNARVGQVVDAIRVANESAGPVNVIGHSYGGPDAYNAAVRAKKGGHRVDNLIVLDGVTAFGRAPEGDNGADNWMNVVADPKTLNRSDRLTHVPPFSQNPAKLPVAQSDHVARVDANHEDVGLMMRRSGARALLDHSRRSSSMAASDTQSVKDWMAVRHGQVRDRGR